MSGVAEFERDILIQRSKDGTAAARARGKRIGRPPKLCESQVEEAHRRIVVDNETRASVAADYGVAPWTLARALKRQTKRPPR